MSIEFTQDKVARAIAEMKSGRISRREAMRRGLTGAAGLMLADRWSVRAFGAADAAKAKTAKAKSVIQIWMWGGPTHLDTFDMKPDAGPDYAGPL